MSAVAARHIPRRASTAAAAPSLTVTRCEVARRAPSRHSANTYSPSRTCFVSDAVNVTDPAAVFLLIILYSLRSWARIHRRGRSVEADPRGLVARHPGRVTATRRSRRSRHSRRCARRARTSSRRACSAASSAARVSGAATSRRPRVLARDRLTLAHQRRCLVPAEGLRRPRGGRLHPALVEGVGGRRNLPSPPSPPPSWSGLSRAARPPPPPFRCARR